MSEATFFTDISTLREHARKEIEKGAVTKNFGVDLDRLIAVLNTALASELICVLRYQRHYYTAEGLLSAEARSEFLEHSTQEQTHAKRLAERITQLGGKPDFSPDSLSKRAHSTYHDGCDLEDMVKEDLIAERVAVDAYCEMIQWIGDADPTTRRLLEDILAEEEHHADDMAEILQQLKAVKAKAA